MPWIIGGHSGPGLALGCSPPPIGGGPAAWRQALAILDDLRHPDAARLSQLPAPDQRTGES